MGEGNKIIGVYTTVAVRDQAASVRYGAAIILILERDEPGEQSRSQRQLTVYVATALGLYL